MFTDPVLVLLLIAFVLQMATFFTALDQRVPVLIVIIALLVQLAR